MRKVLSVILIVLSLFMVTGCEKKEPNKKEEILAEDEVVLEGINYKLDQDESGYGINYKIATNLRKVDTGNALNYFSEKIDGESYFVFRIFHYKNKSIDYAIKDTTTEYDNKYTTKINDLDYTVVHFVNPIGVNVETKIYYYKNKKDVYAFCFTSAIDVTRLEEVFLKQVVYK